MDAIFELFGTWTTILLGGAVLAGAAVLVALAVVFSFRVIETIVTGSRDALRIILRWTAARRGTREAPVRPRPNLPRRRREGTR